MMASGQSTHIIRCNGLTKVFGHKRQRVVALDKVDLLLKRGEFTLLMGPSGSGKSSLIACLGGLLRPNEGEVYISGKNIWGKRKNNLNKFRRKKCGFVFQSTGLFPALSAIDQITLPLHYLGFSRRSAVEAARTALDNVGLSDRYYSRPHELSGGENQRVAIARMLAKSPELIFCDEPTSSLDRENGENVARLLRNAASTYNAMILCVTHDERLRPFSDRVLQIEDGKILSNKNGALTT